MCQKSIVHSCVRQQKTRKKFLQVLHTGDFETIEAARRTARRGLFGSPGRAAAKSLPAPRAQGFSVFSGRSIFFRIYFGGNGTERQMVGFFAVRAKFRAIRVNGRPKRRGPEPAGARCRPARSSHVLRLFLQPPCTGRYARWCERSAGERITRLLLDSFARVDPIGRWFLSPPKRRGPPVYGCAVSAASSL